jgi:hypothetical protein
MESTPLEKPASASPAPWADHHQAYSSIVGSIDASKVEAMKKAKAAARRAHIPWHTLCPETFGTSHSQADRLIRAYDTHGLTFFRLTEIGRVGINSFHQLNLAERLDGNSILIDGEPVEIAPENAARIRAAVDALRRQRKPSGRPKPPAPQPPEPEPPAPAIPEPPPAAKPVPPSPGRPIHRSPVEARAFEDALESFYDAARKGDTDACRASFARDGRYINTYDDSDRYGEDFIPGKFHLSSYMTDTFFPHDEQVAWVSQFLTDPPRVGIYRATAIFVRVETLWRIAHLHISKVHE